MLKNGDGASEKVKGIKDAQDRKEISISYFNSVNSALAVLPHLLPTYTDGNPSDEIIQQTIVKWRDWFLSEHREHRQKALAELQASIVEGGTAIERLEKASNLVELRAVWVTLTEDERRNSTIIDTCNKLKSKYETIS